jgi:predicted metallo-beta-lactamase superfamily hydrolase
MDIEILATESLGVRSLCCFVKTKNRKILIDPGIALGYTRYGLLPHPLQVAVDERIQRRIRKAWSEATDIVISHFHGDHTPLADANPYQFNIKKVIGLNTQAKIWTKDPYHLSPVEKKRAKSLSFVLNQKLISSEGKNKGAMIFSKPVPHGEAYGNLVTVIMTKIEEDCIFLHASDNQLLNNEAISQILSWKPDVVLTSGPPLYLYKLSGGQIRKAQNNAKKLSEKVNTLILDHHLMRSYQGVKWLKRLSSETGKKIICGADFMKKPRMLLEARRQRLYKDLPVPEGWHEAYARGIVDTNDYWNLGKKLYKSMKLKDEK